MEHIYIIEYNDGEEWKIFPEAFRTRREAREYADKNKDTILYPEVQELYVKE